MFDLYFNYEINDTYLKCKQGAEVGLVRGERVMNRSCVVGGWWRGGLLDIFRLRKPLY